MPGARSCWTLLGRDLQDSAKAAEAKWVLGFAQPVWGAVTSDICHGQALSAGEPLRRAMGPQPCQGPVQLPLCSVPPFPLPRSRDTSAGGPLPVNSTLETFTSSAENLHFSIIRSDQSRHHYIEFQLLQMLLFQLFQLRSGTATRDL